MENWTLAYDGFEPEEERLREALTSTGNGYFCTRGSFSWTGANDVHYPGTYVHGGFNRETTIMAGVPVLNEDLVNLPNWLLFEMRIEGEEAVGDDNVELLSYRHELDVRNAEVAVAGRGQRLAQPPPPRLEAVITRQCPRFSHCTPPPPPYVAASWCLPL